MPRGFAPAAFASAIEHRPAPNDVYLSAYPKCGTTWTQYMVYLLLHEGRPLPPTETLGDTIPHLEETGAEAVKALPAPRIIKTHLPLRLFPFAPQARYVYIVRNPFDCVVSFYHHTRGFPQHYDFADGSFDDFFECFLEGAVDFGDYFDHVVPWTRHWDEPNVLLLVYERMRADPAAAVAEIAAFLAPKLGTQPDVLAAVTRHSSLDHMRRDQQRWSSARSAGTPEFVRKGVVGDWRNHLSPAQAGRLLAKFRERCMSSPLGALWPDVLAEAEGYAAGAKRRSV